MHLIKYDSSHIHAVAWVVLSLTNEVIK